ncbi:tumor necrosis factor ligand superfamily member 11 [Callorhinchus milii]|eukprot:gi/632977480/ref/XP_007905369.1/ PREDICTED: tumor necrosis factor ligand superfamily member 11 [Callorhinchus milii]
MVMASEPCSQLLQGLKNIINQVVHSALSRQRHTGHITESTESSQSHHPQRTPCAHLTMKRIKDSPDLKTKFIGLKGKPITSWEEKIGIAHTIEMSHNQGLLKIKHHGLYYIYAQILFRYHAENPISTEEYQLVQYVYWKTANYRKPHLILKGAGTWCSGNHNLYSVYLGGVFNLHRGDEIFVTVSNISLVDADETSSYLGAFKLN